MREVTPAGGGKNLATPGQAAERRVVLEQRYRLEFGVDPGFLEKLGRVRTLLSSKHHHIPRAVRDAVWARDRGRFTFVSPGGRRCGSRYDLEIDHIVPLARGGESAPGNLRLLCARHNRFEAERAFGESPWRGSGGLKPGFLEAAASVSLGSYEPRLL